MVVDVGEGELDLDSNDGGEEGGKTVNSDLGGGVPMVSVALVGLLALVLLFMFVVSTRIWYQ